MSLLSILLAASALVATPAAARQVATADNDDDMFGLASQEPFADAELAATGAHLSSARLR